MSTIKVRQSDPRPESPLVSIILIDWSVRERFQALDWLAVGIEAASERLQDRVQKGFHPAEIYKTLEAVWKVGINDIISTWSPRSSAPKPPSTSREWHHTSF
jgi:hypothetical protein